MSPSDSKSNDNLWDRILELADDPSAGLVWIAVIERGRKLAEQLPGLLALGPQHGSVMHALLALGLAACHVMVGFLGPLMMICLDTWPCISTFLNLRYPHNHRKATPHLPAPEISSKTAQPEQETARGDVATGTSRRRLQGRGLRRLNPGEIPWVSLRNYVFAPVAEEWCFRACMVPLLLDQGWSSQAAIIWSTLVFGAAHLHLLLEMLMHEGMDIRAAIIAVLFQFVYTSLFGAYAAYWLIHSGTVLAPIGAHVACNLLGMPDLPHMAHHPWRRLLVPATLLGIATFFWTLNTFASTGWFCAEPSQPCLQQMLAGLDRTCRP
ncbi:hypothetical protein WJX84_003999 [Apatococcus fuscideae]|uniref:intramembrane prenyl-peptidase Rce1 n=1 Tax=Apatococcus fuscideae TaxID=2026836 RepID=A0AAW1TI31_9CHLO